MFLSALFFGEDLRGGKVFLGQHFYVTEKSFVLCAVQPEVMNIIKNEDLEDGLNITPTLSEAYDIVQMEEIERELMDDFEGKEDELNP